MIRKCAEGAQRVYAFGTVQALQALVSEWVPHRQATLRGRFLFEQGK